MHQVSFSSFASAQQAPAPSLPILVLDPLVLQRGRACLDVRDAWWGEMGYSLDATDYIPVGGHDSMDQRTCVAVCGHHSRRWGF